MREAVSTSAAPAAIGPYSQAVRAGSLVFVSGQIPLDPATGTMVDGDIAVQTHRVFRNLAGILEAAGSSLDRVVRATVYLADMNDFAAMNEVYATYFSTPAPARATIQAARLPKDARRGNRRHRRGWLRPWRNPKLQIPNPKAFPTHKSQTVGRWELGVRWSLGFGAWDLTESSQFVARSTSSTPSTLRSDLITFCRCFTSLISTVMSIRPS